MKETEVIENLNRWIIGFAGDKTEEQKQNYLNAVQSYVLQPERKNYVIEINNNALISRTEGASKINITHYLNHYNKLDKIISHYSNIIVIFNNIDTRKELIYTSHDENIYLCIINSKIDKLSVVNAKIDNISIVNSKIKLFLNYSEIKNLITIKNSWINNFEISHCNLGSYLKDIRYSSKFYHKEIGFSIYSDSHENIIDNFYYIEEFKINDTVIHYGLEIRNYLIDSLTMEDSEIKKDTKLRNISISSEQYLEFCLNSIKNCKIDNLDIKTYNLKVKSKYNYESSLSIRDTEIKNSLAIQNLDINNFLICDVKILYENRNGREIECRITDNTRENLYGSFITEDSNIDILYITDTETKALFHLFLENTNIEIKDSTFKNKFLIEGKKQGNYNIKLENVIFEHDFKLVNLYNCILKINKCYFNQENCYITDFKLRNESGIVNTNLENIIFERIDFKSFNLAGIDIVNSQFINCEFKEEEVKFLGFVIFKRIANYNEQELKKDLVSLRKIYIDLEEALKKNNNYIQAGKANFSEKEIKKLIERNSKGFTHKINECMLIIHKYISAYSENYLMPLFWLLILIFIFSGIYMFTGFNIDSVENNKEVVKKINFKFLAIDINNTPNTIKGFLQAIMLSLKNTAYFTVNKSYSYNAGSEYHISQLVEMIQKIISTFLFGAFGLSFNNYLKK